MGGNGIPATVYDTVYNNHPYPNGESPIFQKFQCSNYGDRKIKLKICWLTFFHQDIFFSIKKNNRSTARSISEIYTIMLFTFQIQGHKESYWCEMAIWQAVFSINWFLDYHNGNLYHMATNYICSVQANFHINECMNFVHSFYLLN